MYHPTTRVLTILELLQSYPGLSGEEMAARLEVDVRTVRRYITMLQDMGLPVEAARGRHGGYRLRPGFKLPPLVFNEGEALALTLGLMLAQRLGLGATSIEVAGAAAKLERVLPAPLRAQIQTLQAVLIMDVPLTKTEPMGAWVLELATAVQQQKQVQLHYCAWNQDETVRLVDPYGVVYRAGYWYLPAYCHLRAELRTFRLDRVLNLTLCATTFERPTSFDPLAHVNQALATMPGVWAIDVCLHTTLAEAQQIIPPSLGTLTVEKNGVALTCYVQNLAWFAHFLAGLDCSLQIRHPAELRLTMQNLAAKAAQFATDPSPT